jgi:DNA-binding CsgD family transcriptional regulator
LSEFRQIELIAEISSATDADDLKVRMCRAAREVGFDNALFGLQVQRPYADPLQHVASGFPAAYQKLYAQRGFIMRDPTVAFCQTHSGPLVWSEQMYEGDSVEILEESRTHGLGYGFSVPVHESAGVDSMLSMGRDKPFDNELELKHCVQAGLVIANVVHVAAKGKILPMLQQAVRPRLTPREAECLKWVADGKSNGVIADLLNLSEAAVDFHLKNLYRKLGVSTRLQAVVLAMSLGML